MRPVWLRPALVNFSRFAWEAGTRRAKAEEALRNAKDKADIAVVEAELAMLAAQAVAARKLRQTRSTH